MSALKNRRISNIKDYQFEKIEKMLFDVYVEKRWYYVGGNFGEHLQLFNIIFPGEIRPVYPPEGNCDICERSLLSKASNEFKSYCMFELSEPSEIFYIRDPFRNKKMVIGKCCIKKYRQSYVDKSSDRYDRDDRVFNLLGIRLKLKTE